jgi:osmoprotectant transport system ATP-binding protein
MIRLEGVSKHYPGGTIAVDDLTLTAPDGKITVLVGPSGCGKTTSLRMINRMIETTSGTITIEDRDISTMDAADLRRGIGYVIQHGGLFPHHTIERNVATVPLLLGWSRSRAKDRARELLDLVGLEPDLATRYPSQLSGGQQQRVGVARALAADPPVMLMDEPFSAVDPIVREQLQEEFLRLQAELGKTIVFVTHDIDEAIKLGDQVAVLRIGGRLAQVAEPSYLLAHPADDFVADFVGRDRGYRALSFTSVQLKVHDEPFVHLGASPQDARAATRSDWLLVTGEREEPLGWVEPNRLEAPIEPEILALGGTLARHDGPLRHALDAALSSPSRRGVIVDDEGRLVGTVRASEVLEAIESVERPEVRQDDGAHALEERAQDEGGPEGGP